MKKQNSIMTAFPVLFGFFVMGFCDIVGIPKNKNQTNTIEGTNPVIIGDQLKLR